MKRLCLILAYLFLFTQTASAMPLLVGQKVVYRGTVTGLRISAVDGTAFIDNLPYTYSSDFSVGVDSWLSSGGTAVGNIDGIGAENDWIRLTISNASSMHFIYRALLTIGKKYTVSIKYYIPSTNSNLNGIKIGDSGTTLSSIFNTLDTVSTATFTFTAGAVGCRFYGLYGSNATFQDAGGDDVFYIKDIKISEIQPFMDGNHQIEIYDSSNRMLKGVLKAAGTSETLGDEKIDTWVNNGYDTLTLDGSDIDAAIEAGTNNVLFYKDVSSTIGAMYKFVLGTLTITSGKTPVLGLCCTSNVSPASTDVFLTTVATGTYYVTSSLGGFSRYVGFRNSAGEANWSASGITFKQVTAPSSAGCTIVSAKGGTTYNFSYKNASFTYNAASYYVIIRAIR